jgi:hypothetical protein
MTTTTTQVRERLEALIAKWEGEARSLYALKSVSTQAQAQGMLRCVDDLRAALAPPCRMCGAPGGDCTECRAEAGGYLHDS